NSLIKYNEHGSQAPNDQTPGLISTQDAELGHLPLRGLFQRVPRPHSIVGSRHPVWNHSDRAVELQVRVGSILKKVHTLKPGCSKRLECKSIYKAYMPGGGSDGGGGGMKSLLYYYDQTCHPYVWVNDTAGDSSRMVKQQYISLEDLRDCSEIRVFRDHQRGCISVRKKPRPDSC
ncbi:uncharacterized protein LOC120164012, partial [Hibiscus syriacus]|uniref:uncharacterized protein LOC120164012 n=1 Tax=Hibiscus syriacus TaxID=106335 RepID=UPI0019245306